MDELGESQWGLARVAIGDVLRSGVRPGKARISCQAPFGETSGRSGRQAAAGYRHRLTIKRTASLLFALRASFNGVTPERFEELMSEPASSRVSITDRFQ